VQHGERAHAVLDHQLEFSRLGSMRKWAYIGPDGKGNAGRNLLLEILDLVFEQLHLEFRMRSRLVSEILEHRKGGNGGDFALLHDAHGLIAQLRGVIDGGDTGLRRVQGYWMVATLLISLCNRRNQRACR